MPHSVEMDGNSPAGLVKDEPMEDTDIPGDVQAAEEKDGDAKMDEASEDKAGAVDKKELNELFADIESDDEFPSSAPLRTRQ